MRAGPDGTCVLATNIPCRITSEVMAESGDSAHEDEQHAWVRHVGYKQLDDGKWFIAYQDDESRFIVGFGVFGEATQAHALQS